MSFAWNPFYGPFSFPLTICPVSRWYGEGPWKGPLGIVPVPVSVPEKVCYTLIHVITRILLIPLCLIRYSSIFIHWHFHLDCFLAKHSVCGLWIVFEKQCDLESGTGTLTGTGTIFLKETAELVL